MSTGKARALCNNNPFCSSLSPATRAALCNTGMRIRYEKKQVLHLNIGANAQLMLLDKGEVITTAQRADGKQKGIEYLREGDIMGLARLFGDPQESVTITLYARAPLEVCFFSTKGFEQLCMTYNDLAREVIRNLCHRFLSFINDIEHIALDTSEEKVLYLVQTLSSHRARPQHFQRPLLLTHEELGLLAGINRVTVTRVLDRLKASGKLATGRGVIEFLPPTK